MSELSFKDAAALVLDQVGQPLHHRAITQRRNRAIRDEVAKLLEAMDKTPHAAHPAKGP